jgi:SAM-dependent methyltransferase
LINYESVMASVERYYTEKVMLYGATPQGVDWNSRESQILRFEQLLQIVDENGPFSIVDYGCGYGALLDYLAQRGSPFQYHGYDVSREMIVTAKSLFPANDACHFVTDESLLPKQVDFAVASGIFNVRLDVPDVEWQDYMLSVLTHMHHLTTRGFAFNALTKYSDAHRMRSELYYADPCFLFDYCKTRFSRHVAVLHDYGLYEFTVLVRKRERQSQPGGSP